MSPDRKHPVYEPDDDGFPEGTPPEPETPVTPAAGAPGAPAPDEDAFDPYSLSTLQLYDLVTARLASQGAHGPVIRLLRERISELEDINDQARSMIEELNKAVEELRAPALRIGTLLRSLDNGRALVCVNGTDYVCSVDPKLHDTPVETGSQVLLNEAYAVADAFGFDLNGPVVNVREVLPNGRLRIGTEAGTQESLVVRSTLLEKEKIKAGTDVRLDGNQRIAVEVVGQARRVERSLTTVEAVDWDQVGGNTEAIEAIRDTIELPFLHASLFQQFQHAVPKGFLLYGPPGCGKTLMARATAHNLREEMRRQTGHDRPEFFLHVKGPEILNMWLGESERQVRDLFAQCREKAAEGSLAFLFIDEAESVLGTRGSFRGGASSIISTLVPMFCAEMDGIEPLANVVIILASNRADLIDPAILRPGRIDRKIRVRRPDRDAAHDIYRIYLPATLPIAGDREQLIDQAVEAHFARIPANRFLEVTFRSGKKDYLYRGDLASGALIAGIVQRAKGFAIKRSIRESNTEAVGDTPASPLTLEDITAALDKEYAENELFPPGDLTEDWLKLTDFDPGNVVRLAPCAPAGADSSTQNRGGSI
ncbi:MAG: AAA family ATPase [Opitutales bacterium]